MPSKVQWPGAAVAAVVRGVQRAPGRTVLLAVAVMALGVGAATQIRLEDDVRALIEGADPQISDQLTALSEFTAVDQLLLHVDGGEHPEQIERAAEVLVEALGASDQLDDVRFEASPTAQLRLVEALMPRRFLLDPRDPETLFAPRALRQALAEVKEQILAPQGLLTKPLLLRDPLGSVGAALGTLSAAPGLSGLDASSGRFYSRDGRSLLVVAMPRGNPFGGSDAARTMAVVHRAVEQVAQAAPGVTVRPIGSHRFTHDAERMVQRDVHLCASATLLIVLLIFVAFFRQPRLALVALPPLAFGACVSAGIAGLMQRPVHGIVLAFSAACLGLSIDYSIHLIAAAATTPRGTSEALPEAARKVGGSLALAAGSTLVGLAVLATSTVPALRQMALLAAGAVAGAFVGNLLWVPVLLPRLWSSATPVPPLIEGPWSWAARLAQRRRGVVLCACALLATLFALSARNTHLRGDLHHLDTRDVQAEQDVQAFGVAFGDPSTAALALVEAATLDAALDRAARATDALAAAGIERIVSPASLAPPRRVAEQRRNRWCTRAADGSYADRLEAAGAQLGYRPQAFAAFRADLQALCAADGRVLVATAAPTLQALEALLGRPVVRPVSGGSAHSGRNPVRLAVAFEADATTLPAARAALASLEGVLLTHRQTLDARLLAVITRELPRLAAWALGCVTLLLFAVYRQLTEPLRAMAPCLLGLLATLAVLAWLDLPINVLNLCVFPLLAGLGIDYGILMSDGVGTNDARLLSERAFSVTVAAATTLAGFGTLAMARYAGIATIGQAVLIAVTACALFALVLPAALQGRRR